jgi:thioredoxin-like negative regulator of GroEL
MNSLLFLTEQDFSIQQGKKGQVLCNNLPGVSLVLFFSKKCPHCGDTFPIFHDLPRIVPGCRFAVLNISTNVNVARMSQQTIAPITVVPFIILYVNGRPFMKYNGEKSLRAISGFVNEVLSRIQSKKNFSQNTSVEHDDDIPEYSVGIPFNLKCEGEQCYLTFSEAYKK